jgi:hypothetical protein
MLPRQDRAEPCGIGQVQDIFLMRLVSDITSGFFKLGRNYPYSKETTEPNRRPKSDDTVLVEIPPPLRTIKLDHVS